MPQLPHNWTSGVREIDRIVRRSVTGGAVKPHIAYKPRSYRCTVTYLVAGEDERHLDVRVATLWGTIPQLRVLCRDKYAGDLPRMCKDKSGGNL